MKSNNLHKAKTNKNDEFYTRIEDIEGELQHYKDQLVGKHIYMNCDNPNKSNFWKYFKRNFDTLGLRKITSTYFDSSEVAYRSDYDGVEVKQTSLSYNGDFRSPEGVEILKECDIVITNPPFSLYREYVALLMEHEKDFLIIGNFNSVTYKEIFPLIKDEKMWTGYSPRSMEFDTPEGGVKSVNAKWFTNLNVSKRREEIKLTKLYNVSEYPQYDNYEAIEVGRVNSIPVDYDGVMGVPITFIENYNPEQFELLWVASGHTSATMPQEVREEVGYDESIRSNHNTNGYGIVDGIQKFHRVLIKKK